MRTNSFLLPGLLVSLAVSSLHAQPANDACSGAVTLTVNGGPVIGTNVAATYNAATEPSSATSCWSGATVTNTANNTVWYRFTPSVTGQHIITTDFQGAEDTQILLYSGACGAGMTRIACSEDNGLEVTTAAVITANLNAGTTYSVMVDIFGTTTGVFRIEVRSANASPANDCISGAIDITALIDSINNTTNPFSGNIYQYNDFGTGNEPTVDSVEGDPSTCHSAMIGIGIPPTNWPITQHYDVWFRFTVGSTTPPAWLSVYQHNGTVPNYSIALFQGPPTPVVNGTCGSGQIIRNLVPIDCSAGDYASQPNPPVGASGLNLYGGVRDMGVCTTPIRPRIDISGLPPGTYYVRVFETAKRTTAMLTQGAVFKLMAESAIPANTVRNLCPTAPTVGCADNVANRNVNVTYLNQNNAGMTGNSCNTASREPQLVLAPVGQVRESCVGTWVNYIGDLNNVINNTAIYQFAINSAGVPCNASVTIKFDNIVRKGAEGGALQLQVMNGTCEGAAAVMTGSVDTATCVEFRPVGGTLPNGNYWIVADGQDGELVKYDITLTINYSGTGCSPAAAACGTTLSTLSLGGEQEQGRAALHWWTPESGATFTVERSADALSWVPVASVAAEGVELIDKANGLTKYRFSDQIPGEMRLLPAVYYRVRSQGMNGVETWSGVLELRVNSLAASALRLFPNPARSGGTLFVEFPAAAGEIVSVSFTDINGTVLREVNRKRLEGSSYTPVELTDFPQGAYFVTVRSGGRSETRRLVLNRE